MGPSCSKNKFHRLSLQQLHSPTFLKSICGHIALRQLSESTIKNHGSIKVTLLEISEYHCAFNIGRIRSDPLPHFPNIRDNRRVAHNDLSLQKRKAICEQLTPK
jgi:hypothetical protein